MEIPVNEEMPDPHAVAAEEWLDERVSVEPGGTLWVQLDRGAVEVTSHDGNEVHVQAEARGWAAGMATFSLVRHANDVEVDGSVDTWFPLMLGRPRIEVRAWVPRDYSVEIETRGGRIRVENVRGRVGAQTRGSRIEIGGIDGPVLAVTSGGRIEVIEVAGDLRARTSGGGVRIADVRGDVEARTSGGNISIDNAAGQVNARTTGGSIRASFANEPWGRLETSGGSIEVQLPVDAGTEVDARTSGGTVSIDRRFLAHGKGSRSRFRGDINEGGPPLRLRTSGGSIRVRPLGRR